MPHRHFESVECAFVHMREFGTTVAVRAACSVSVFRGVLGTDWAGSVGARLLRGLPDRAGRVPRGRQPSRYGVRHNAEPAVTSSAIWTDCRQPGDVATRLVAHADVSLRAVASIS